MPTSAADVDRLRSGNQAVTALALQALNQFWASLDLSDPDRARDQLRLYIPELVATFGQAAAAVAADWYEQLRLQDVGGRYTATLATVPDAEVTERNVRYFAGHLYDNTPMVMLSALQGIVQKRVVGASRDTIRVNAFRDRAKPRYARVPVGKTCAFCTLLASRGFVYATAETAGEYDKYHLRCDCVAAASFTDDPRIDGYDPDELYSQYASARDVAGADLKSIAAEMRRQNPDLYTDGVHDHE